LAYCFCDFAQSGIFFIIINLKERGELGMGEVGEKIKINTDSFKRVIVETSICNFKEKK